jgi:[ribosomal protein S5]-alanine N-acetyltransferase
MTALGSDPRNYEHSLSGAPSDAESTALAREFVRDWERHGIGYWVVEHDGRLIGMAGVRPGVRGGRDYWNLYFRFVPEARGQGFAREAVEEAIRVAHSHEPRWPVLVWTRPANAPAARLAEAVGMTRAAELDADGFIVFRS